MTRCGHITTLVAAAGIAALVAWSAGGVERHDGAAERVAALTVAVPGGAETPRGAPGVGGLPGGAVDDAVASALLGGYAAADAERRERIEAAVVVRGRDEPRAEAATPLTVWRWRAERWLDAEPAERWAMVRDWAAQDR